MATTVDQVIVTLEARLGAYMANIAKAQQSFEQRMNAIESKAAKTSATVNSTFGRFLTGAILLKAAHEAMQYADAWTNVGRSLQATEQFFNLRLRSSEGLAEIAKRSRSDLTAVTQLYTRTAIATRGLGLAEQDVADVTETVAKALKIGGATAGEQASTLLQLSQAFQKGKLDGDEFRTVMENATVIQDALIKRLGITKSQLYAMSQAGKIGVKDLINAIRDVKPAVDKSFSVLTMTFADAFTNLGTGLSEAIGKFSESTGAGNALVFTINAITFAVEGLLAVVGDLVPKLGTLATNGFLQIVYAMMRAGGGLGGRTPDEIEAMIKNIEATKVDHTPSATDFARRFGRDITPAKGKAGLAKALNAMKAGQTIVGGEGVGKAGPGQTPAEKFAKDVQAAKDRIADLKLERDTLGETTLEHTRRKTALDLEQEAVKAGIKDLGPYRDGINQIAEATAQHTAALEFDTAALERQRQASTESFSIAREGLLSVIKGTETWESALQNVIARFGELALNNAFQKLFEPHTGGATGGLFGGIFDILGGLFAGGRAGGGTIPSGKFALTGERGPELVRGPATVHPNSSLGGGSSVVVNQYIDARNSDAAAIAGLRTQMARQKGEMISAAVAAVNATRSKRPTTYLRGTA